MPVVGLLLISEADGNPNGQAAIELVFPSGSTSFDGAVCTLNLASSSEVTALGDKTVKAMYFATISSGTTSGTITKPASGTATLIMDEWGTSTDAILSTIENGKPTFISPVTATGDVVGTSFNTAGEYAFDGTPSPAADHALIYVYTCKLSDFISSEVLFESELDITKKANTWAETQTFSGSVVISTTLRFAVPYSNGNSGASKTIAFANGQNQTITLTDNATLTVTAPGPGTYSLKLIQDGTGSRVPTWATSMYWPNGIPVVLSGVPRDASDNAMTNCTAFSQTFFIFSDRFTKESSVTLSGNFVCTASYTDNIVDPASLTDVTDYAGYYENSGSEAAGSAGNVYNSADYIVIVSDEVNFQSVDIAHTDAGLYNQYFSGNLANRRMWYDGTLAAGTHTMCTFHIIDSAARDGATQIYNEAARIIMGDQYKDYDLDS